MYENSFVGVNLDLDKVAENYDKEYILNKFKSRQDYKVENNNTKYDFIGCTYDTDNTKCVYVPCNDYFRVEIMPQNWEKEIDCIIDILNLDDKEYQVYECYHRYLDVDESEIEEFTNAFVKEIEEMGYNVDWESSSGMYVMGEETINEYKIWIYIKNEDGNLIPHMTDIIFTENGPILNGTVEKNKTHAKSFRRLINEFHI